MGLFDAVRNAIQQVVDTVTSAIRQPLYPNIHLTDIFGRSIIIHGLNICNASKRAPGHLPWHTYEDLKRYTQWGFNGARLLVFWSDVEPVRGTYNDDYIKKVAQIISNLKSLGVWVIVDFHQDLFSEKFDGDGAPDWAVQDNGLPYTKVEPWAFNYLQPAVMVSFQNFWNGFREEYLAMIKYTMTKINSIVGMGVSNILAVDVMNEPFKADLFNFESSILTSFYYDAASRMPTERIGAEPAIIADAGLPTSLAFNPGPNRGLFLPHYYDAIFQTTGYNPLAEQVMWTSVKNRVADANRMNIPILFGEFGASTGVSGWQAYVDQFMKVCEAHTTGWLWYAFDKKADDDMAILTNDGQERPVMNSLVRVYARAIAGTEPRFSTEGKKFTVTWKKVPGITAPTEIFIPPRFTGIQILVNGVLKPYMPSPARPNILNVPTVADQMKVEVFWTC